MRSVLTIILISLVFSLFSQSRLELNLFTGAVILNEVSGAGFTTGSDSEVGVRYVFDRDTLDDFFQTFVGASAGLFRFQSEFADKLYQKFTGRIYIGFTPVDDVYFSINGSYHTGSNAFVPSVRIEAQPFDRFLWTERTNLKLTFFLEGGSIKYLEKPTSPTGFVSFGIGLLFHKT